MRVVRVKGRPEVAGLSVFSRQPRAATYFVPFSSSSSFSIPSKTSSGCAPVITPAVQYSVGVEFTPIFWPSAIPASTRALYLPPSRHWSNFARSSPSSSACFFRSATFERLLVGEHLVVHLPELALLAGAVRGLGGLLRLVVEGQRVVLEARS